MVSKEITQLLGLSKNEIKVIHSLEKDFLSIADIAVRSKMPRMTAHETIGKLVDRGLVLKKKNGARHVFGLDKEKFLLLESVVKNENNLGKFIFGRENMFSMWEEIRNLPKETRIYAVQPTASMKEVLQKLDWDQKVTNIQKAITEKPIIIEGLLSEDYYPFIFKYYKDKNKKLAEEAVQSFVGRATDMVFVSSDILKVSSELYILPHAVYLLNWRDEVMLKIENKNIVELLKEFFNLARGYGKKVDQNAYIKNLLNNYSL